jgi:hypothetical protein
MGTVSAVSTGGCLATTSILRSIWLWVAINACSFNGQAVKHPYGPSILVIVAGRVCAGVSGALGVLGLVGVETGLSHPIGPQ